MFRYITDVLSLSIYKIGDFVDRNYLIELDSKDTTDTAWSASYLDLRLKIAREVRLKTKCTTKRLFLQFFPICMEEHSIKKHLYMEYISLRWSNIPEFVVLIMISLIEDYCNVVSCFVDQVLSFFLLSIVLSDLL